MEEEKRGNKTKAKRKQLKKNTQQAGNRNAKRSGK